MPKVRLRPLRYQIIIMITILIAGASALFYFYSYQNFEALSRQDLNKQAGLIKQHLITTTEAFITSGDSAGFTSALGRIFQNDEIAYLIVQDSTGGVVKEINTESAIKNGYLSRREINDYSIFENDILINVITPIIRSNVNMGTIFFGLSKSEFIEAQRKAKIKYGIISAGIFIGGLLLNFLIGFFVTRHFKKILKDAKKISDGDYSQRIKTKNKDEFSQLANSFNILAERLEESNSQVVHLNNQLKTAFRDKLGELNLEINQRRIAESSLKQSEEQFRLLFNIAPIGMVITTPERKIQKVNKAFENTLGYNFDELSSMRTIDLTYYDDKSKDENVYKEFLKGNIENKTFEKRFVTKKGDIIDVIVRAILYKDEKGKPVQFIEQVVDVTEQNKMQRELLLAKEKAEESDKMKSAFLAQMSHEIRTPLNVILAASSIFEEELKEHLDEDSQQVIESVKSAGKRLLRTIDLILNMSAIQADKYEPYFEKLNINKELKNLVEEFKPLGIEKKIQLCFATHTDSAEIKVDKYTVHQIFQNLISNAIKYTRKGKVEVVVFKTDKIFVEIKDTGIGMSKEYLQKLFNPFSQEDVGQKREFEGNGLGLALVKKYVEINNADIKVESEKDMGSTFTIIFNN